MPHQRPPEDLPLPTARGALPILDAQVHADLLPPDLAAGVSLPHRRHLDPYVGVTEDGTPRPGLYRFDAEGAEGGEGGEGTPSGSAVTAARAYLDGLAPYQRTVGALPMDAPEWRLWTNAFPTWRPKGMRLERLAATDRARALAVIEASLSPAGYAQVRAAMALNASLGDLIGDYQDSLTEFAYWFTVFGTPSAESPWGWQLMGHHVDLHCVFVAGRMVLAPVFLGAEPTTGAGRYAGVRALGDETEVALAFRRALGAERQEEFLLGPSLRTQDLPPELTGLNGRQLAGAGYDNLVLPPEGVVAATLPPDHLDGLLDLVRVYLGRLPRPHAERALALFREHLAETRFAWRGGHDDVCAFYYRIHSPVLLVEYDNHPGVFLTNPEPARYHVHTIVRAPNGNDYARDLLTHHYRTHHTTRAAAQSH